MGPSRVVVAFAVVLAACAGSGTAEAPPTQVTAPTTASVATTVPTTASPTTASGATPAERVGNLPGVPSGGCRLAGSAPGPRVVVVGADERGEVESWQTVWLCVGGFADAGDVALVVRDASGKARLQVKARREIPGEVWYPGLGAPLGAYSVEASDPGGVRATAAFSLVLPTAARVVAADGDTSPTVSPDAMLKLHVHAPVRTNAEVLLGGPVPDVGDAPIAARAVADLKSGRGSVTLHVPSSAGVRSVWCVAVATGTKVARCQMRVGIG